jgi:hypothetical protein
LALPVPFYFSPFWTSSLSAILFLKIHFPQKEIADACFCTPLIMPYKIAGYSCACLRPDVDGRVKVHEQFGNPGS